MFLQPLFSLKRTSPSPLVVKELILFYPPSSPESSEIIAARYLLRGTRMNLEMDSRTPCDGEMDLCRQSHHRGANISSAQLLLNSKLPQHEGVLEGDVMQCIIATALAAVA